MSSVQKIIEKIYKKPVPNDITYDELIKVAKHFGCYVKYSGGRHPLKIANPSDGTVIPIPTHGNTVKETYIKQCKDMFDRMREV